MGDSMNIVVICHSCMYIGQISKSWICSVIFIHYKQYIIMNIVCKNYQIQYRLCCRIQKSIIVISLKLPSGRHFRLEFSIRKHSILYIYIFLLRLLFTTSLENVCFLKLYVLKLVYLQKYYRKLDFGPVFQRVSCFEKFYFEYL